MAITITKEPSALYPAYNDSFIQFTSDLADNYRAEITVYPVIDFPRKFIIYADTDGNYTFNLKEQIRSKFSAATFRDANYNTTTFFQSHNTNYKSQDILIEVFSDDANESVSKTYTFYRYVKQIGEELYSNDYEVLLPTVNGVDFYLPYWEGFPLCLDIKYVQIAELVSLKNVYTSAEGAQVYAGETGSVRYNVDRGDGNNFTNNSILVLNDGINHLELNINTVFKSNIYITKKTECSGIYLKWANNQGGYSHWLFENYFSQKTTGKDDDYVLANDFGNVGEVYGVERVTSKTIREVMTVKTSYKSEWYNVLKELLFSPSVQMYTSTEANVTGEFIDVYVNGSLSYLSKKKNNEATFAIELPESQTLKL